MLDVETMSLRILSFTRNQNTHFDYLCAQLALGERIGSSVNEFVEFDGVPSTEKKGHQSDDSMKLCMMRSVFF